MNLTEDQIKFISEYLLIFQKAYYLARREKLETVAQIIDLLKGGEFTFEDDVWGIYLDAVLGDLKENEIDYFDNHIEDFMCEVYFPAKDKTLPDGGAWIKIRTNTGFEVHYAKKSIRKKRWDELIEAKLKSTDLDDLDKAKDKISNLPELLIRQAIGKTPYEVYIYRTKTKKEYLLTTQYTIVEDIEQFSNAYMESIAGVYSKKLYSYVNKDAIFYLQSRGIPKKVAEVMASLKQLYFIVNMEEAMNEYNRQWSNAVSYLTL